ncbi:MAG: S8 family serine peptidase, partial [Planctomycetes bacterium]|nr:S8 family serine peptidase [Planctomycetota bacterium]
MATRLFFLSTLAAALLVVAIVRPAPVQEDPRWDLLTHHEIGADRFKAAYPDLDGKGVVIAVLDTGVDMGAEGLRRLPDGKVKVIDVRDFSTEGDLFWKEARIVPGGDGEKVVDAEGRGLSHFRAVAADAYPERFYLGFIEEAKFADADVKDLNGDGDTTDVFGILIFTVREPAPEEAGTKKAEGDTDAGAEEKAPAKAGALRYVAVIDVNGDGKLDDGVRVTDYWRSHDTFVLAGKKGARRQLTFAANFYPEEGRLSLHFDSGGHGTHVAGIAAGHRIHGQDGYDGLAPGARVLSLKIGNNRYSGGATVTESIKKALDYAVEYATKHKVPIVYNMSFGIGSEVETKSAIDVYVDELLWKNPGVVFVTSAGNEGPGLSSVGMPGTATRAISVGALLGPEAAHAQYGFPLKAEVAFPFSSRGGDTFKPDILAPGSASSTVPLWGERDHY